MAKPGDGASAQFDVSQLVELANQMVGAKTKLRREVSKVIKRGANNIKKDAQKRYREQAGRHGKGHAWRYPASIDYDVHTSGFTTIAVIGPNRAKPQAALGNLLEYGSAKNAPLPHLNPALDAELPKTGRFLAEAMVRAVLGP